MPVMEPQAMEEEGAAETQAEPLEVSTLPEVPGATLTGSESPFQVQTPPAVGKEVGNLKMEDPEGEEISVA